MTEKYYLTSIRFMQSSSGTIFRYDGRKLVDVHKNNDITYNGCIPQDWIEVQKEEAIFLAKKLVTFRLDYQKRGIYYHIKELNISDRCYFLNGRRKTMSTIISKIYKFETLHYKIMDQNGLEHMVPLENIELLNEIMMTAPPARRENIGGVDGNSHVSSEQSSQSTDIAKEIMTVVRCNMNHIDTVDPANIQSLDEGDHHNKHLSLKQGDTSSIVKLRWKGRVNGMRCLGCELSKDCKYGTNGTFQGRKLFECADKRGVLILVDGNVECCESGARGAAFSREEGHNKIEADVFIDERCICCAEKKDKLGSKSGFNIGDNIIIKEDLRGTVKWAGLINGERCLGLEVETEDIMKDGTFNGMKMFECHSKKAALVRLLDISKTMWCEQIRKRVLNPTVILSLTRHRDISKYVVYREDDSQFAIEVKWLGKVDDKLCYGCVLPSDDQYGTNGKFKGNACFECAENRGVLIAVDEFRKDCVSIENKHDELRCSDSMSVVEGSVCCIESTNKNVKIPTGVDTIVNICNTRHLLKCLWIGRINGMDSVGLEMDSDQHDGTDGTFCGLRLFKCKEKRGLLFNTQNIRHVLCLEIVRDIFLRKDYELTRIPKEKYISEIGKQFQVKCTPEIRGTARFCMKLLNELFMGLDIGPDYLQKDYGPLKDVLYEDNIVKGSCVIIVKLNSVKILNDKLTYKPAAPVSCINVARTDERWDHGPLKVGDTVKYEKYKHNLVCCRIVGFQMMNHVRNVGVVEIDDDSNNIQFIPEDEVRKFIVEDLFTENAFSPRSNSNHVNGDLNKTSKNNLNKAPQSTNHQGSGKLNVPHQSKPEKMESRDSQKTHNGYHKNILETEFDMGSLKENCNEFVKGQPVNMVGEANINGRALFNTSWSNELLLAIEVDSDCIMKHSETLKSVRLYDNGMGIQSVIIVRLEDTDLFHANLTFISKSEIINQESIRWKWNYERKKLKKGDFVSYKSHDGERNGRIERLEWLNKTRCVGLVDSIDSIGDSAVRYIQEYSVIQVLDLGSYTKYYEQSVFDPKSIIAFKQSRSDDLSVDDEVEGQYNNKKLYGKVMMLAEANGVPCAVIEVHDIPGSMDIRNFKINDVHMLKEVCKENRVAVIVKVSSVKKRGPAICRDNNVYVVDAALVKTAVKSSTEDRMITFQSNGEAIVAKLKWVGNINGELCIGCDMRNKSNFGTNGMFGGYQLFDCDHGKGVLIPLERIKDYCIHRSHKKLAFGSNRRIMGSSVCCVQRLEQSEDKRKFKLEDRVQNDKGNIFGICRWVGLINNVEALGLEMVQCGKVDHDGFVVKLALFPSPPDKGALFPSDGFTNDTMGLRYCTKNGVCIMDANNINSVEYEEVLKKNIIYQVENKTAMMDVRWGGRVNGVDCVGCQLAHQCKCGTEGVFIKSKWFDCLTERGVMIPIQHLRESCLNQEHTAKVLHNYGAIKQESVCCVEERRRIESWPQMKIGSKLKFRSDLCCRYKIGSCKWMGLVNGRECIGTNLKESVDYNKNRSSLIVDLLKCHKDRGAIFMHDDLEHDINGEKVNFVVDKIVDLTNIWKIKTSKVDIVNGMKIGDYVSTSVNDGVCKRIFNGELKWIGLINRRSVVGLDLEDTLPEGMDGSIGNKCVFECPARHGIVTTTDNVQRVESALSLSFTVDGTVDADKYLKCEEKWNEKFMRERHVSKNGIVHVIVDNGERIWKRKGTLRWAGTMNGESVAVVELSEYYENGTNGRFWRKKLITCGDNLAVSVPLPKIHEYSPYEETEVPKEKRLFQEIDINSAVVTYIPVKNERKSFFGTVKWSGIDDFGTYFYGIELDDRYSDGTDGKFYGKKLFHCQDKYGVLVEVGGVAPDVRFVQKAAADEDIPQSEQSVTTQYSIPVKTFRDGNRGIQGNANSCYFDSTIFALFSKSDVLDFMISPLINEKEKVEVTKLFRDVMSWGIVYPLREFGFVSFHKTQQMREIIKNYGPKFEEMLKHETDMENVSKLLSMLSPDDQLLRLTTFVDPTRMFKNKCMFMQLFVVLDRPEPFISSQQMLDISMAQNDIMFDEAPTCLIMQAPRDARGINCYDTVLPSKMIEISHLCLHSYKMCSKCDAVATIQCKKCVEQHVKRAMFCHEHDCHHECTVPLPDSTTNSRSEIQMILKAIICIERAHFVAYVKEDEFKENWVFFDSMSTQDIRHNFSVPNVSFDKTVSNFLNLTEEKMREELDDNSGVALKRILKDSYIFVYHNSTKTCY